MRSQLNRIGRAHLLSLVLGHVGLELEVGGERAAAKLALVGAVYHHHLLLGHLLPPLLGLGGRGRGQGRGGRSRWRRGTSALCVLRRP